jgi:hypothetical protein
MQMKKWFVLAILTLLAVLTVHATVYNAGNAHQITPGQVYPVWVAESPTPGNGTTAASQQISMPFIQGQNGTPFHAHGFFSGAPGAFEIDVQVSDDDVDTHYQTITNGNVSTVDATNFTWHMDAILSSAKFARLLMRSRTNAVSATAWIGR